MGGESESTQMYYRLLQIKADDKAYIPHTSDSIILPIVEYYEKNRDEGHLMEAYYFAGRVYSDLGDAPQALGYFQKAVDASGGNTDYKAVSRIYSQMGELCLYQDIYDDALEAYKRAYYYNKLAKDSLGLVFNLRDIGCNYTGLNKADSSLYYYKAAYALAEKLNNQRLMNIVQGELAGLYTQLKRYDEAREALKEPLMHPYRSNWGAVYATSFDLYFKTGNLDSASYYAHRIAEGGASIYAELSAHWVLAQIAEKRGEYSTMMEQVRQYAACTDSIQRITNSEVVGKMQSIYNYQLREKENNRLKAENTEQRLWISYILLALVVLVAFGIIYMQYNKRRKERLKEQLRKLEQLKDEQYQKSAQFIDENNKRIRVLEEQLHAAREKESAQLPLLELQKERYQQLNSKAEFDQRERNLAEAAFRQSSIYRYVHQLSGKNSLMVDNDWIKLTNAVDKAYNGFTSRLYALYSFSLMEIRICLLIKANISATGISVLTGRSKSAITSARKRMYEKVYAQEGKPEQWDALIEQF
jgi:cell division protein FtsL